MNEHEYVRLAAKGRHMKKGFIQEGGSGGGGGEGGS